MAEGQCGKEKKRGKDNRQILTTPERTTTKFQAIPDNCKSLCGSCRSHSEKWDIASGICSQVIDLLVLDTKIIAPLLNKMFFVNGDNYEKSVEAGVKEEVEETGGKKHFRRDIDYCVLS